MDSRSVVGRLRELAAEIDGNKHVLVPFDGTRFLEEMADQFEKALDDPKQSIAYPLGAAVEKFAEKMSRA